MQAGGGASAAGQQSARLTVGQSGTDYGYASGLGSLSFGSYKGKAIIQLINGTSGAGLINIAITGVRPQTFFRTLRLETDAGTILLLTSASASFSAVTNSFWEWGSTGSIWTTPAAVRRISLIG